MSRRLRLGLWQDASVSAVVLLDCFAAALATKINDALAELEPLFTAYLGG